MVLVACDFPALIGIAIVKAITKANMSDAMISLFIFFILDFLQKCLIHKNSSVVAFSDCLFKKTSFTIMLSIGINLVGNK